jgi:hypothetical protein
VNANHLRRIVKPVLVASAACLFAAGWSLKSGAQIGVLKSPETPVEQARKNIQVLKGLPERDLFPLMNSVAASLGVRCDHCHVKREGSDDWVWESDEKEAKRTARRMMQMVVELNAGHAADFRGQRVSCHTCHRGSLRPELVPTLPLAASGHEGGAGAGLSEAPLPSAAEVLSRYVSAVGGREAVARLKTRVMKGVREASQGRVWPIEITAKGDDRYLVVVSIPAQGDAPAAEVRQALAAGRGWVKNPGGVRELRPNELADLRKGALDLAAIKIPEPFPPMTVVGRERVGGREAFALEAKPVPGTTSRYLFDAQTGLLLRVLTLRDTVLNSIPEQIDFEGYREVDGVKLPFTVRVSNIDTYFSSTRRFSEIRHNVAVEDSAFEQPPAAPRPTP